MYGSPRATTYGLSRTTTSEPCVIYHIRPREGPVSATSSSAFRIVFKRLQYFGISWLELLQILCKVVSFTCSARHTTLAVSAVCLGYVK
jgi:hypothetical protein